MMRLWSVLAQLGLRRIVLTNAWRVETLAGKYIYIYTYIYIYGYIYIYIGIYLYIYIYTCLSSILPDPPPPREKVLVTW